MKKLLLVLIGLSFLIMGIVSCDSPTSSGGKNNPPAAPTTPTPANGAINQRIDTLFFGWTCTDSDDDILKYGILVYHDTLLTANLVAAASNLTTPAAYLRDLSYGRKYIWFVFAYDNEDTTYGPLWSFTTKPNPAQLSVTPTSLVFGTSSTSQTFNITNTGSGTLRQCQYIKVST